MTLAGCRVEQAEADGSRDSDAWLSGSISRTARGKAPVVCAYSVTALQCVPVAPWTDGNGSLCSDRPPDVLALRTWRNFWSATLRRRTHTGTDKNRLAQSGRSSTVKYPLHGPQGCGV